MTAITPTSTILSVSFTRRGLVSRSFVCACCNLQFDRDEHMKGYFNPEHSQAVITEYGYDVCVHCADQFQPSFEEGSCPDCQSSHCHCDFDYESWRDER